MKNLFLLILVLITFYSSGQKSSDNKKQQFKEDEITERFLKNGAWKVSYFSQEYQKYIDSAIELAPDMAYLYQQKGMPYFKQSKNELGFKYLNKAVELDPKNYIAYRAYLQCIFARNYIDAISDFQKAKKLLDENGIEMDHSYNFYIGLSHLQLGNYSEALQFLQKSIDHAKMKRGESWIHYLELFYAGIALQELNKNNEAIVYFDQSLKSYPNFCDALYYKSKSLFSLGQSALAEEVLTQCEVNFKKGFSINEDNAVYERYPYQIKEFYFSHLRKKKP